MIRLMACPSLLSKGDKEASGMMEQLKGKNTEQGAIGYILLWLIGVPLPILIILFLIFR
jgi:hypothetical protein